MMLEITIHVPCKCSCGCDNSIPLGHLICNFCDNGYHHEPLPYVAENKEQARDEQAEDDRNQKSTPVHKHHKKKRISPENRCPVNDSIDFKVSQV